MKRFKQLLFRRRPDLMEGILGSASRIVQPPLSMRPSGLRKSKSQDTHERPRVESALAAEGVHRNIKVDESFERAARNLPVRPGPSVVPPTNTSGSGSTIATQPSDFLKGNVVHDNMSSRPPIAIPNLPINSAPTTPTLGKGHAHDPLEDHLYLNIGTGEDAPPVEDSSCYIVSESPSNADINVYETAYQEEIARIQKEKEDREARPTLYLTRRVENMRSLKDSELVYDSGRTRDELKASIKLLGKRAAKGVEERAEMQRMKDPEGKEGLLYKGLRNVREFKDLVDEAREIVREEERRDGKRSDTRSDTWKPPRSASRGASRSSTPTGAAARGSIGSRSGTPLIEEKEKV